MVNIIVAVGKFDAKNNGFPIGKNGTLPWKLKEDMKWFKEMTIGHPVIMGRKTYESIGKPLNDRINIVITSKHIEEVCCVTSVEEAIRKASELSVEDAFIIGGASVYNYSLKNNLVDRVYIDFLSCEVNDADSYINNNFMLDNAWTTGEYKEIILPGKAVACCYERCKGFENDVDSQYLDLINDIIKNGEKKETRAGMTRSVFGRQLRFNLKKGLPMLTTKKMFSKGVIHELLWFIKGDTNIKYLVDNGVHIWDDDAYRYYIEMCETHAGPLGEYETYPTKEEFVEYVKKEDEFFFNDGVHYKFGDLNRVYGAQWTDWGGHNQVKEVIETLKKNPNDRRMIISAWNVAEIPEMALPPCHFCCQFYTKKMTAEEQTTWLLSHNEDGNITNPVAPTYKLSCMFHMRSNDIGAGTPFNWASYAILTHMIAQCVNMDVNELIYEVGDAHIYENHIELLKEQLKRNPHMYALPKLVLNPDIKNIEDFTYDDIKIEDYQSYPAIKLPLNVGL